LVGVDVTAAAKQQEAPASWAGFRARILLLLDYACAHHEGSPPRACMVPADHVERVKSAKYGYLGFCEGHFEQRKKRRAMRHATKRAQLGLVR
jgi:hypothetical protein